MHVCSRRALSSAADEGGLSRTQPHGQRYAQTRDCTTSEPKTIVAISSPIVFAGWSISVTSNTGSDGRKDCVCIGVSMATTQRMRRH